MEFVTFLLAIFGGGRRIFRAIKLLLDPPSPSDFIYN